MQMIVFKQNGVALLDFQTFGPGDIGPSAEWQRIAKTLGKRMFRKGLFVEKGTKVIEAEFLVDGMLKDRMQIKKRK